MRLIDSFYYSNEPVAVERIKYLRDYVDLFIIFEADCFANGLEKKFSGQKLLEAFPDIKEKIVYVPIGLKSSHKFIKDNPVLGEDNTSKTLQKLIFSDIKSHLIKCLADDDIVFISYADEIMSHELALFVKKNASKFKYPIYALGDHIVGSTLQAQAETNIFHTDNYFISYKDLNKVDCLYDLRYTENKKILMKSPMGVGVINENVKFNANKTQHKNVSLIAPLIYKFEKFFCIQEHYIDIMCNSMIVNNTDGHYPYFKNNSLSLDNFIKYRDANFEEFKKNILYITHHLQPFNLKRNDFIIHNIPKNFYEFGYGIAERLCCIPNDVVLENYYNDIYGG